jgi:uncharacterized membrane-anchored protein
MECKNFSATRVLSRCGIVFRVLLLILAAVVCFGVPGAGAQWQTSKADLLRGLNFQQRSVTLGNDLATITQSTNFYYLAPADAKTFLTRIWDNPPEVSERTLGVLLPAKVSPLAVESWGVIINYEPSGYVSDEDAEKIDYPKLLQEMQAAVLEASKKRVERGYESYELVGWARQPYYDKATKKLYWAKRLKFGNSPDDTLNYEIRVLGRQGVMSLNVVADVKQLALIDRAAPELLSMVSFNAGNLYSEFNPKVDEVAAYGIAGLIAGGLLTKAGFFKGLLLILLASKKLAFGAIIGLFAGLWGIIKALFNRKKYT